MNRNYNEKANYSIVQDLWELCEMNAENERNLFEVFHQEGEVSVYDNLDPFTGCPDDLSTVLTLKSETEVKEYLKKDFLTSIKEYLEYRKPDGDYLLNALIEFIKENRKFPEKDVMRQLEEKAEAKRITNLSADTNAT